jgi:hypothetical protein
VGVDEEDEEVPVGDIVVEMAIPIPLRRSGRTLARLGFVTGELIVIG